LLCDDSAVDSTTVPTTFGDDAPGSSVGLGAGTRLGRYVLLERRGQGAMGIVYAAYDPELDRRVAVKVLHGDGEALPRSAATPERLVREAQALARLSHPNVVAVHDVGVVDGHVFVAMEFVEGRTLRQWIGAGARTHAEILDAMIRAGRGLAAAHAAGLVHRDFKPDNVIMGDDGRVRVLDFGLARASGESSPTGSLDESGEVADALTRTGALMGTPAYMAPEQFLGGEVDGRTDQFAFCVTAWELVYGERPFRGNAVASLGLKITREDPEPPPSGTDVPAWVHRVLVRGLQKSPDARWPTLDALLDELALNLQPPARRGTPWPALGLAGIAAAGIGAAVWVSGRSEPAPCEHASARMDETWNESTRATVEQALRATGHPLADDTAPRVTARIDAWAARWVERRTDTCEATHVRHEQSDAALDLRMHCLEGQRAALAAWVDLLAAADTALVARAVAGTEKLEDPARCDDLARLERGATLPTDPAAAERVETLEQELTLLQALQHAGRVREMRESADAIVVEARELSYPPLLANAAYVRAVASAQLGEHEPALAGTAEALSAALATSDAEAIARIYLARCRLLASTSQTAEADACVQIAGGAAQRTGVGPEILASWHEASGLSAFQAGRVDEGLAALRRGLALVEETEGESTSLAAMLHNFGDASRAAHRLEEGERALERAVKMRARLLGDDHPDVAFSLNSLAVLHIEQGRTELALEELDRVLQIRRRVFGDDHDFVAGTYNNIGHVHLEAKRWADAAKLFRRAIEMRLATLGESHPKVAAMRTTLARCELELGEHESAAALATSALEHLHDPSHAAERCDAREILAQIAERRGDTEGASTLREGCTPAERP
jgi:tetratricopeptide (TPR) repeat protein